MHTKSIAFVPCRSGSVRIRDKNIRRIAGHPLLGIAVMHTKIAKVFDTVAVVTDSDLYARVGLHYGADLVIKRPAEISTSDSPDFDWVNYALGQVEYRYDIFAIIRPTSPFRTPQRIVEAYQLLVNDAKADSVRAVEAVSSHPGKMWASRGGYISPLFPFTAATDFWHNNQTGTLPPVLVQNASIEVSRSINVTRYKSISGSIVKPVYTENFEGVDINTEIDCLFAEYLSDFAFAQVVTIPNIPAFEER